MMDLGGWLWSLGLGKYEAAFRENEIDETVLRSLTDEHLKQLPHTRLRYFCSPKHTDSALYPIIGFDTRDLKEAKALLDELVM